MDIRTVGSVCSGIEAASVAWKPLGLSFEWFSEIASFPSRVLSERYPSVTNLGDMGSIPSAILDERICPPDLICGGTPCQAFSLAGWKNGLNDERGNLTLKFTEIIEANDLVRVKQGLEPCIVFWENVEGVLTDKTNAFGCFVAKLAGANADISVGHWPNAGVVKGPKRNVAWRVFDAKFFGVPQQRRRLYVLAGGKGFNPENVLFEKNMNECHDYPSFPLVFEKEGHSFEVFREYTDCLYSAYGTKWNGNAAAYNGSLFIVQDSRIRRFSPLECERLMGFPDDYTNLPGAKRTNRYQALGNSWVVPVVRWIGQRLVNYGKESLDLSEYERQLGQPTGEKAESTLFFDLGKGFHQINGGLLLNCSAQTEDCSFASMQDIVSPEAPEQIYISPVGCYGILRRSHEYSLSINRNLYKALARTSSEMSFAEIEGKSRMQNRGRASASRSMQFSLFS